MGLSQTFGPESVYAHNSIGKLNSETPIDNIHVRQKQKYVYTSSRSCRDPRPGNA